MWKLGVAPCSKRYTNSVAGLVRYYGNADITVYLIWKELYRNVDYSLALKCVVHTKQKPR